ncbi:F0F1 ATP synthase subunit A [Stagnihabitans tardus]|uniref:ATP synthase subunit a n=1 Tax=Stagnihabitans tardus TaxID=2699202 RepID=A0AAE4Y7E9_9RHOB|nr:F0F1 ATP synthase subunit A [Stagnihabitans tardus]NBZ86567.1 F0F1 ATP synthase subunit A [Stagnihabitans tardus]
MNVAEAGGLLIDPMHQFQIVPLFAGAAGEHGGGHGPEIGLFTITNQTLWLGIAVVAIFLLFVLGTARRSVIPGRVQSIGELIYGFIHDMVEDVLGHEGAKFFPWLMVLFTFIVTSNLLGLLPKSFSPTSHIAVTAVLALGVFLTVTLVGLYKKGLGFLGMFWVSSAPLALRPILAVIELISYFVRPLSHSIRLGGNIMAGHAVIKVFAGFASIVGIPTVGIAMKAGVSGVSILAIAGIYGLELLVAVVQAYVFTILTCVYLRDAVGEAHH